MAGQSARDFSSVERTICQAVRYGLNDDDCYENFTADFTLSHFRGGGEAGPRESAGPAMQGGGQRMDECPKSSSTGMERSLG